MFKLLAQKATHTEWPDNLHRNRQTREEKQSSSDYSFERDEISYDSDDQSIIFEEEETEDQINNRIEATGPLRRIGLAEALGFTKTIVN